MFGKRIAQGLCVTAAAAVAQSGPASAAAYTRLDFPGLAAGIERFERISCHNDGPDSGGGGGSSTTGSSTTTGGLLETGDTVFVAFGAEDFGAIPAPTPVNCHTDPPPGPGVTAEVTREIAATLDDASQFCGWLPAGVRIDCVADRMRTVARALPRGGDYARVRNALENGARELTAIARQNEAPRTSAKRYAVRPPDGGAVQRSGRLTEVAPDRLAAANAAAARVIEETQTVLLRSAENSRTRMVHFQEIATALDSSKVLLRST